MRNSLLVFIIAALLFACGSNSNEKEDFIDIESLPKEALSIITEGKVENVSSVEVESEIITRFKNAGLIDATVLDPSILVELRYSGTNNFLNFDLYGPGVYGCYLHPKTAEKLVKASEYLRKENPELRLLVYDAARPHHIQQLMWDKLDMPENQKKKYVTPPSIKSIHNFGAAVDLTLANEFGEPLDMGTEYDYFGIEAHTNNEEQLLKDGLISAEQLKNRRLLRKVMTQAGFSTIEYEWWHFNSVSREYAAKNYTLVE